MYLLNERTFVRTPRHDSGEPFSPPRRNCRRSSSTNRRWTVGVPWSCGSVREKLDTLRGNSPVGGDGPGVSLRTERRATEIIDALRTVRRPHRLCDDRCGRDACRHNGQDQDSKRNNGDRRNGESDIQRPPRGIRTPTPNLATGLAPRDLIARTKCGVDSTRRNFGGRQIGVPPRPWADRRGREFRASIARLSFSGKSPHAHQIRAPSQMSM